MPTVEPNKRHLTASRWALYQPSAKAQRPPTDLDIRPATKRDCDGIAAIEASRDGVDADRARHRCEDQIANPETLLLVAIVGGDLVGFGRAGRLRPIGEPSDGNMPEGWYLLGVGVVDQWRRHGIGRVLTERRLAWLAQRTEAAYYFANARNQASLDLHGILGFEEVTRHFRAPGIEFEGGEGLLCRLDLSAVNTPTGY